MLGAPSGAFRAFGKAAGSESLNVVPTFPRKRGSAYGRTVWPLFAFGVSCAIALQQLENISRDAPKATPFALIDVSIIPSRFEALLKYSNFLLDNERLATLLLD